MAKNKRILMLLENAAYPSDERVRHEAMTLSSAGYQIIIICPKKRSQLWHEIINNVIVYRYPSPRALNGLLGYLLEYGYSMAAIFLISLYVSIRDGFDIIHTAQPPDTFVFIGAFYKLFGKLYLLDHHDLAPELYYAHFRGTGSKLIYRTLIWLERLSFRFADHVISTNESYRKIALQRGCVKNHQITIVRNGPDLEELSSSLNTKQSLKENGRMIIGYVGVMGVQDGVDNLLRVVSHLVHKLGRTNILCVIVGAGSALPGLKTLSIQLDITPYILFTGWIWESGEIAEYFKIMDICVAPEPSDPYNDRSTAAKVMEYMAMGKPIVSFDLPEHRFTAQGAAVYAVPGDELDFANKIAALMDDPELRSVMGRAGQSRIEVELAWPHQAKQLLKAYESLAVVRGGNNTLPKAMDSIN